MARIINREDADKQMVYAVAKAYAVDEYVVDGGKGGIALNNIANGADGVVQARCVVADFKKAAGSAWVEGTTYLYFDPAAKAFTHVVQADGLFRGRAYKDAANGDVLGDVEIIEPISNQAGKADLAVPVAAHTVAGLTALGNLETTGILTADVVTVAVPVAAHTIAALTAAGKLETSSILTADVVTVAVPVAAHTVAGLTAAGKLETTGVLTADLQVTTTPVAGHTLAALTAAGKLETSGVLTADVVQTSDRRLGIITVDEACAFGAVPAAPVDGYRVLVTTTGGAYVKGTIYTFTAGAPGAYDAGVLLGNGQIVGIKTGATGDIGLGGNAGTDLFRLSDFGTMFEPAGKWESKDLTVLIGQNASVAIADDPDWVGASVKYYMPVSGVDQLVAGHTLSGTGGLAITLAAVTTAEAVYRVTAYLA